MIDLGRYTKLLLLVLTVLHLGTMVRSTMSELQQADGLIQANGAAPVGGDFINMFAAARLVLDGRSSEIYQPEAFMAFERTIIPHDIGLRLWAYPPHSLLAVWPLGWMEFWGALTLWSALGLAVLVWGARRAGFDWIETAIIALSPAALASVYFGQTGNLAAGLLLLALSGKRGGLGAPISAALLTIKPQAGFLLPVLWLVERKWSAILIAGGLTIAFGLLSLAVFGPALWIDYLGPTMSALNALEHHGSGPFMAMIPSVFIAVRILAADPMLAGYAQAAIALLAGAFAVWRLIRTDDERARWAIVIAAMALITPYVHIYDLASLMAAALLVLSRWRIAPLGGQALVAMLALAVWALPLITVVANTVGFPAGPVVIALLLLSAGLSLSPSSAFAQTEKSPI